MRNFLPPDVLLVAQLTMSKALEAKKIIVGIIVIESKSWCLWHTSGSTKTIFQLPPERFRSVFQS